MMDIVPTAAAAALLVLLGVVELSARYWWPAGNELALLAGCLAG